MTNDGFMKYVSLGEKNELFVKRTFLHQGSEIPYALKTSFPPSKLRTIHTSMLCHEKRGPNHFRYCFSILKIHLTCNSVLMNLYGLKDEFQNFSLATAHTSYVDKIVCVLSVMFTMWCGIYEPQEFERYENYICESIGTKKPCLRATNTWIKSAEKYLSLKVVCLPIAQRL